MELCWIPRHAGFPGNEIADEKKQKNNQDGRRKLQLDSNKIYFRILMTSYMKTGNQSEMRKMTNLKKSISYPAKERKKQM